MSRRRHPKLKAKTEVARTYKGKGLFGKHKGTFVFKAKPGEDKKRQLKLKL
jgi:hypothetical protein